MHAPLLHARLLYVPTACCLLQCLTCSLPRLAPPQYDSMTIHVQTHFARAVVAWCASAPEPPPLNLLQVPYKAVGLFLYLLHSLPCKLRLLGGGQGTQRARKSGSEPPPESVSGVSVSVEAEPTTISASAASAAPAAASAAVATRDTQTATDASGGEAEHPNGLGSISATQRRRGLSWLLVHTHGTFSGMGLQPAVHWLLHGETGGGREEPRDYEGTTVKSVEGVRNSWEIWKEKLSEQELAHNVSVRPRDSNSRGPVAEHQPCRQ